MWVLDHGLLRNYIDILIWVNQRSVLVMELIRSQLHKLLLSVHYMVPRDKNIAIINCLVCGFEDFFHNSTFSKPVFCLGEKNDVWYMYIVNNDYSPWYNRAGNICWFGIGERSCLVMDLHAKAVRQTPFLSVRSMSLRSMMLALCFIHTCTGASM